MYLVTILKQTCTERKLHGKLRYAEHPSRGRTHTPRVACKYTRKAPHRRYNERSGLTAEALRTLRAVIKYKIGSAVAYLTYAHTAYRSGYNVIGRRILAFHKQLPHGAPGDGKEPRAPVVVAIRACRIIVKAPVVRVQKHVGAELVVVPFEALLEIFFYRVERYVSEIAVLYVAVKGPQPDIEAKRLAGGTPEVSASVVSYIGRVGRHLRHHRQLYWHLPPYRHRRHNTQNAKGHTAQPSSHNPHKLCNVIKTLAGADVFLLRNLCHACFLQTTFYMAENLLIRRT